MGICWTCKDEKFEREQQSDAQAKTRRINIRESTERYV